MAGPTKNKAVELLKAVKEGLIGLELVEFDGPEVKQWVRDAQVTIEFVFPQSEKHIHDFTIPWRITIYGRSRSEYQQMHVKRVRDVHAILESMIKEVEVLWEDDLPQTISQGEAQLHQSVVGKRVFVIHGRNHGVRDTVARFLERLGLEAVILAEQPNQGRTVIEKLEDIAGTDFAVALLTPDDEGGLKNGVKQARSRQNVILELGYFMGRLGRDRVCALVQGDVEIPSDYYGVLYIQFDESGAWQQHLMRELRAAGFNIDANHAF